MTPRWPSAPRSCSTSASCSTNARASWPRSSPPSTARSSPTPSAKCHAARKSSNSPAASRICSRAGSPRTPRPRSTSTRSANPSARSAIISPFNFPAMVPMWFFPIAIATGNTVVLKPSEKDPTASLWMANLWAEAGLPAGVFNVLQGDKTAVDELLDQPQDQVGVASSAPPRSPVRLRHRHRHRQTRPSPGRGQEPRGDPARRRPRPGRRRHGQRRLRLGRANAAWPSPPASRSAPSPTTWSPRSPNAPPHSRSATAPRTPTWARWSPRPTATRSPPTSTPAKPTAPRSSSTGAPSPPTAERTASGWAPP